MTYEIVAVGASWGGLNAVEKLLAALPADFPPAIVIAQHRSADVTGGGLSGLLERHAARPVGEVGDKDPIRPGSIYLAPADYHVLVEPGHFSLSVDDRVQHSRPSIDVLFESVADAYRERAVGIVLTGANPDGAAGLARIKQLGGVAIVQDPAEAEATTMPAAALRATEADAVLPLAEIALFLIGLCALVPAAQRPVRRRQTSGGGPGEPGGSPGQEPSAMTTESPVSIRPRSGLSAAGRPVEGAWGNREVPPDRSRLP